MVHIADRIVDLHPGQPRASAKRGRQLLGVPLLSPTDACSASRVVGYPSDAEEKGSSRSSRSSQTGPSRR